MTGVRRLLNIDFAPRGREDRLDSLRVQLLCLTCAAVRVDEQLYALASLRRIVRPIEQACCPCNGEVGGAIEFVVDVGDAHGLLGGFGVVDGQVDFCGFGPKDVVVGDGAGIGGTYLEGNVSRVAGGGRERKWRGTYVGREGRSR